MSETDGKPVSDEPPSTVKKTKFLHPELVSFSDDIATVAVLLAKEDHAFAAGGDSLVPSDEGFDVEKWKQHVLTTLNAVEVSEDTCPVIEVIFDNLLKIVWCDAAFFSPVREALRNRIEQILDTVVSDHDSFEDLVDNGSGLLDDME